MLLPVPLNRHRLEPLDPRILAITVRRDVGWVASIDVALERFVLLTSLLVLAQIGTKCEMALNIVVARLIEVQVVRPKTAALLGKVPAAGKAIFAPGQIAGLVKCRTAFIQFSDAPHQRQEIDDGLGRQIWNGRAADMMHVHKLIAEQCFEPLGFAQIPAAIRGSSRQTNSGWASFVVQKDEVR